MRPRDRDGRVIRVMMACKPVELWHEARTREEGREEVAADVCEQDLRRNQDRVLDDVHRIRDDTVPWTVLVRDDERRDWKMALVQVPNSTNSRKQGQEQRSSTGRLP